MKRIVALLALLCGLVVWAASTGASDGDDGAVRYSAARSRIAAGRSGSARFGMRRAGTMLTNNVTRGPAGGGLPCAVAGTPVTNCRSTPVITAVAPVGGTVAVTPGGGASVWIFGSPRPGTRSPGYRCVDGPRMVDSAWAYVPARSTCTSPRSAE